MSHELSRSFHRMLAPCLTCLVKETFFFFLYSCNRKFDIETIPWIYGHELCNDSYFPWRVISEENSVPYRVIDRVGSFVHRYQPHTVKMFTTSELNYKKRVTNKQFSQIHSDSAKLANSLAHCVIICSQYAASSKWFTDRKVSCNGNMQANNFMFSRNSFSMTWHFFLYRLLPQKHLKHGERERATKWDRI